MSAPLSALQVFKHAHSKYFEVYSRRDSFLSTKYDHPRTDVLFSLNSRDEPHGCKDLFKQLSVTKSIFASLYKAACLRFIDLQTISGQDSELRQLVI